MTALAAWVFGAVALFAVGFQLALAAGAPLGELAMGGRYPGRFPPRMRVAAVVQGAIIGTLAVIVLTRAGVVATPLDAPWLIWLVVAFSAVSLVLNSMSRSPKERRLWVPVAILMLASSIVVAANPQVASIRIVRGHQLGSTQPWSMATTASSVLDTTP